MSRSIRKACVGCHIFIITGDIGSRKPGFVVVMHRNPSRCTKPLGSILKSDFDTFRSGPAKVRIKSIKVRLFGQDRAWKFHSTGKDQSNCCMNSPETGSNIHFMFIKNLPVINTAFNPIFLNALIYSALKKWRSSGSEFKLWGSHGSSEVMRTSGN